MERPEWNPLYSRAQLRSANKSIRWLQLYLTTAQLNPTSNRSELEFRKHPSLKNLTALSWDLSTWLSDESPSAQATRSSAQLHCDFIEERKLLMNNMSPFFLIRFLIVIVACQGACAVLCDGE